MIAWAETQYDQVLIDCPPVMADSDAAIVGRVGAAIGFSVGTWIALHYGPSMFHVTGDKLAPMYDVLWWSLVIAPVFAAMASLLPTMSAVLADPAVTLRED